MTQSRNLFVGNVSLLVSNSRLYPMSVYIAYIRILSRFYPFIPFPFLVLGSCTDHLFSSLYPIAPFSHPMARPQDLKDLFRQAGTILRADVALGPDNRSRGFGTVVFATNADAERAVRMFNGQGVAYCGVWVGVELRIWLRIWLGLGTGCWIKIGTPTTSARLCTRHAPVIIGALSAFCTLIFAS